MIGYLGPVVFQTSTSKILTFKNLEISLSPRWGEHTPVMDIPKQEFIGPGARSISLLIHLNIRHGIEPEKQFEKLIESANTGEVLPFFLGNKAVGNFVIQEVKMAYKIVTNKGKVWNGDLNLTLKEYGDEPYIQPDGQSQKDKSAT